jgi:hypothetical protein
MSAAEAISTFAETNRAVVLDAFRFVPINMSSELRGYPLAEAIFDALMLGIELDRRPTLRCGTA